MDSDDRPDPSLLKSVASYRGRGRPTPAETAEITGLILAAAGELFLCQTFEETSIEAIAARAQVKKDTIYKRYPDKRAILLAVLQEQRKKWQYESQIGVGHDLVENLKSYAVALVRHASSPEGRIWIRQLESAWPGQEQLKYRHEAIGYDRATKIIAREISGWTAKEPQPARNPELVAMALMTILAGWIDTVGLNKIVTEDEIVRIAHDAVDLLTLGRSAW